LTPNFIHENKQINGFERKIDVKQPKIDLSLVQNSEYPKKQLSISEDYWSPESNSEGSVILEKEKSIKIKEFGENLSKNNEIENKNKKEFKFDKDKFDLKLINEESEKINMQSHINNISNSPKIDSIWHNVIPE